jgi:hypothetical protein
MISSMDVGRTKTEYGAIRLAYLDPAIGTFVTVCMRID